MTVVTLRNYTPQPRNDAKPWVEARLEGAASESGPWAEVETFELDPQDADASAPTSRSFTSEEVEAAQTWLRIVFVDEDGDEDATEPLERAPALLASRSNVTARLKRQPSNEAEERQVDFLLFIASGVIAEAGGRDDEWIAELETVPRLLRGLCTELVVRAMANPQGLRSQSQTLGSFSHSESFRDQGGDLFSLSPTEEGIVRRVVNGANSGSVKAECIIEDLSLSLTADDPVFAWLGE